MAIKYILKTVIEKKDKHKRYIQNQGPISLLNVDLKIISNLISSQQTEYVKSRHIGENGRSISDFIKIAKMKKQKIF